MAIKTDCQIKLQDDITIGYAELGDPAGKPVLHFHGMPSSRLEITRAAFDEAASRLGVRIIAIDRPGYGFSDFRPFRIVDWPDMVSEFADRLGLEKFAVMGISSGPKYAAACAWKLPGRVSAAALISANAPIQAPEVAQAMASQDRMLYTLARYAPWLLRALLGYIAGNARKDPKSVLSLFSELCEADRALLAAPGGLDWLSEMVLGAFRQGTARRGLGLEAGGAALGLPACRDQDSGPCVAWRERHAGAAGEREIPGTSHPRLPVAFRAG